jgi:hypothetical protein
MIQRLALSVVLVSWIIVGAAQSAQVTAERSEHGVVVKIDGQMFTEYWTKAGTKPVLWPILGPTGKPMTRAYPMGKTPNEREDHIHQRSMWFTHGEVNGTDFWAEQPPNPKWKVKQNPRGSIKHREFVEVSSGKQAVVETRNDWLGPDGKRFCEDRRRVTFGVDGSTRWIDFDITLTASNGPVTFGDTKEGTMGIRVAETMKVDAKQGGRIVNSDGLIDKDAWGKRAAWVDYQGPVDGQTVGIAMLNHPSSFRYPTYWHVRTYGLFAANPFGVADFEGKKDVSGAYVLPQGQSIRLKYRVLFHKGNEREGRIAETFTAYAKQAN